MLITLFVILLFDEYSTIYLYLSIFDVKMSCFVISGVFSWFIGIYLTNVSKLAKNNIRAAATRFCDWERKH